jgi:hypothetical protein
MALIEFRWTSDFHEHQPIVTGGVPQPNCIGFESSLLNGGMHVIAKITILNFFARCD